MTEDEALEGATRRIDEIVKERDVEAYTGVGRTRDAAIQAAWAKAPAAAKQKGLRIEFFVGGTNPISWFGAILEET